MCINTAWLFFQDGGGNFNGKEQFLSSSSTLTINVIDEQDTPPVFIGTPYFGYVYEISVPVIVTHVWFERFLWSSNLILTLRSLISTASVTFAVRDISHITWKQFYLLCCKMSRQHHIRGQIIVLTNINLWLIFRDDWRWLSLVLSILFLTFWCK